MKSQRLSTNMNHREKREETFCLKFTEESKVSQDSSKLELELRLTKYSEFVELPSERSGDPSLASEVSESVRPPGFAEKVLLLFVSKQDFVIVGDLAEEYADIHSRHGRRFARVWYWKQVMASAGPLLRKAIGELAVRWLGEFISKRIT